MTVIPAVVAGVKEISVTSPKISPEVIVSAHLSGATKIYKLGGAQAIAAFAYGSESIEKVDKIVIGNDVLFLDALTILGVA